MVERRGTLELPVNGEEVPVRAALHMSCPGCGEIVLRLAEARQLRQDAIATYRQKHG
jgi:hypothetical protein